MTAPYRLVDGLHSAPDDDTAAALRVTPNRRTSVRESTESKGTKSIGKPTFLSSRGDDNNNSSKNNNISHAPASGSWFRPFRGLPAAIVLVLLPVVGLAAWIPFCVRNGGQMGLTSVAIGGKLTQTEAKLIDFLCSAVLAPVVAFCLNWLWFSTARVSILNERHTGRRGMPLATMVEVSRTDCGSYSPFKIFGLVRGGAPATFLLGLLVVLSALVFSTLSNVIAYEAYPTAVGNSLISLCALNDFRRDRDIGYSSSYYNFTAEEQSSFAGQVIGMLTDMAYHNATDRLDGEYYVGINATQASLNALPSNITNLYDVPAYRLSFECKAQPPDKLDIDSSGQFVGEISSTFVLGNNKTEAIYNAMYPGQIEDLTTAYTEEARFVGFTLDSTQAYLGALSTLAVAPDSLPSPYGNVTYNKFDLTSSGFNGSKATMAGWGFRCNMTREAGLHTLARRPDLAWKIEDSAWPGWKEDGNAAMLIADWQVELNFHSPPTTAMTSGASGSAPAFPGLATAFQASAAYCPVAPVNDTAGQQGHVAAAAGECPERMLTDYRVNVLNFLYAAGETERVAREIKNSAPPAGSDSGSSSGSSSGSGSGSGSGAGSDDGSGSSDDPPACSFQIQAAQSDLRYRMTYVPLILLLGLLGVLCASSVSLGLACSGRRTARFRAWRDAGPLRLLVDGVADGNGSGSGRGVPLRDEPALRDACGSGDEEIERWARGFRVGYTRNEDGMGLVSFPRSSS